MNLRYTATKASAAIPKYNVIATIVSLLVKFLEDFIQRYSEKTIKQTLVIIVKSHVYEM